MKEIPNRYNDTEGGLHRRYKVTKIDRDGKEVPPDPNAVYFVLRLDHGGSDPRHILACQEGVLEFARACPNRRMAAEIRELVAFHRGVMVAKEIVSEVE